MSEPVITKHKAPMGYWQIAIDGRRVPLFVGRSDLRVRYRDTPTFEVCDDREVLFEAKSLAGAVEIVKRLAVVFSPPRNDNGPERCAGGR